MSLGIDPLATINKSCNFDCIYCQLGDTRRLTSKRKVYVPTEEVIEEIRSLPDIHIDHLTFSGNGEPTLAKNLGEMIRALKSFRPEKIAVITNASLLNLREVREDLLMADFVLAKLDACSQETFELIHKTGKKEKFLDILEGIKNFRIFFKGKLALQIMLMNENKSCALQLGNFAREIRPDEVELNTPLRPSGAKPLSANELNQLKTYFYGLSVITVYDAPLKNVEPFDLKETIKRHGKYKKVSARF